MLHAEPPSRPPTWTTGRPGALEGPSVLVVEDSPSDMFLIGRALAGTVLSLRCRFSTTLADAVQLARREAPDVVLLDLSLPDCHGIRTLKRIRAACPASPVVVVTGHSELRLAVQALRAGASDYLVKTELATLEPTLRRVLAEAHDERQRQRREASRVTTLNLKSVGRMAAGMAHELNTPLQFVNDNLAFLRRALQLLAPALDALRHGQPQEPASLDWAKLTHVVEQMPPAIEQALEGVQRMARLTAALHSQHELSTESRSMVAISGVIESSLAGDGQPLPAAIRVTTLYDDGLPAISVHVDALARAFSNIIQNAWEAIARSDAPQGSLEISVTRRGDQLEVRFVDDGPGISSEHLGSIFDPFFTTKPVGGGSGQGLAFAHHVIVQQHGGELTAHSTPGRGATLVAVLPLPVPRDDDGP
jgi:two-component system, NtrC family, sensor kinase